MQILIMQIMQMHMKTDIKMKSTRAITLKILLDGYSSVVSGLESMVILNVLIPSLFPTTHLLFLLNISTLKVPG